MDKNKLFILGNGFDLHHKLPTSFTDFKNYIAKKNSKLKYNLDVYFDGDLWSDFEHNLSNLNPEFVSEDNLDLLPNDSDRSGDMYTFEDALEQIVEELTTELKNSMRDWILQIEPSENPLDYLLPEIKPDFFYLTFNYSDTLEKYYKIDIQNILHIHNKAERVNFRPDERDFLKDNSEIILGHSFDKKTFSPSINKNITGLNAIAYNNGMEKLIPYLEKSFKNTKSIIRDNNAFFKKNFSEIKVFGHSISNVDLLYFKTIHDANPSANWEIFYYDSVGALDRITKQVLSFKGDIRNVKFEPF